MPPKSKASKASKGSKGSPNKKGSPDKGSKKGSPKDKKGSPKGKKGEESGPPIEIGIQVEFPNICYQCMREFSTAADMHSHLMTIDHHVEGAPIIQRCRICNILLHIKETETHRCCKYRAYYVEQILNGGAIKDGSPTVCLLCRARRFPSRIDLCIHLLTNHGVNKRPGVCGDCDFKYEEPTVAIPTTGEDELDNIMQYSKEFDQHIYKKHQYGHAIMNLLVDIKDTASRKPYSCPLCPAVLADNVEFHGHVIYTHSTTDRYTNKLNACVEHMKVNSDENKLLEHVYYQHSNKYYKIAKKLSSAGLIDNFVDLLRTCTICWRTFDYDFQLQAHIVVRHVESMESKVFFCGWCKIPFYHRGTIRDICRLLERHERIHVYELHTNALEGKYTLEPLPEKLEDNRDPISDEEPMEEEPTKGKKGSKGSKKDSPDKKKGSPDKKKGGKDKGGKDKSKSSSPKKGKK